VSLEDQSRPGEGGSEKTIAALNDSLPNAADIAPAYCVLAHTPYDRTYRRLFLSLHSAVQAVERARKRGLQAELLLCRLTAVQAVDLDLDGEGRSE
jgi:hypothetical protein